MNKMNYDNFKNWITRHIKEYLPEEYGSAEVKLKKYLKNNDVAKDGLIISKPGQTICPTLYLNDFYKFYKNGASLEQVITAIADARVRFNVDMDFDFSKIDEYKNVKDRILPKLISAERNKEFLESHPHTMISDLAVIYYIITGDPETDLSGFQLTNSMLECYGVPLEQIHTAALENMKALSPGDIISSNQLIIESMLPKLREKYGDDKEAIVNEMMKIISPGDDKMVILTNRQRRCGAAAILDGDFMDNVREKIGEDFLLVPSSVHEFMILPGIGGTDWGRLNQTICEVNSREVEPQEVLSNHVYKYDYTSHQISVPAYV